MKTDIKTLGINYNVIDDAGAIIKQVRVIDYNTELRNQSINEFDTYSDIDEYIDDSIKRLTGFVDSPLKVYWHTTAEDDLRLTDILEICINEKYDYAIIECLPLAEVDQR
jgi:hypothetical protein